MRGLSNGAIGAALAACALAGALMPLVMTKGPLRPTGVVDTDGPLPRQAVMRGPYVNACVRGAARAARCCCASCAAADARARTARAQREP